MYPISHFFSIMLIRRARGWYHYPWTKKRVGDVRNLFLPEESLQGCQVIVRGDAFHYLKHVRRIQRGDNLHAVIGERRYDLSVASVDRDRIICEIEKQRAARVEGGVCIRVYQGLLKQRKMDIVVTKLAELGVEALVPLITERTVPPGSSEARVERWRKLVREGAKVSGIERLMSVCPPREMKDALKGLNKGENGVIILFCTEHARGHLKTYLESLPSVTYGCVHLFFGPEGGFTEREVAMVTGLGGLPVTMGPLVLRSETAAIVGTGFVRLYCTP